MLVPKTTNSLLEKVENGFCVVQFKTTIILKFLRGVWPGVSAFRSAQYFHNHVTKTGKEVSVNKAGTVLASYVGQPNGTGSEHIWQLKIHQEFAARYAQIEAELRGLLNDSDSNAIVPVKNRFQAAKIVDRDGVRYRSKSEAAIATAFEERGITFFVNARSRIVALAVGEIPAGSRW